MKLQSAGQDDGQTERGGKGNCGDMVGFVDEGAYSYAHSSPDVLSDVLTRRYNLLEDWVNGNKLVINPDKTHLLVMGPKSISARRNQVRIQAGQFIIVPTETEKLIGCHLHQSLQWNQHIRDNKHSITK